MPQERTDSRPGLAAHLARLNGLGVFDTNGDQVGKVRDAIMSRRYDLETGNRIPDDMDGGTPPDDGEIFNG